MNQQIKTGLGVVIILIFAAIAGVFVWYAQKNNPIEIDISKMKTNKDVNQKVQKFDETGDYYNKLITACDKFKDDKNSVFSYDCCKGTAEAMRKGGYKLIPENGCPEGFQSNSQWCDGAYSWCEPQRKIVSDDWQTYRNDKDGFEVKYPSGNWEVMENYDGYNDNENAIIIQHIVGLKNFVDMSIDIEKSSRSAKEILEFFLKPGQNGGVDFSNQKPDDVVIDNHKGYKVISGGEGAPSDTIFLEFNRNTSFIIKTEFSAGSSADLQIDPHVCNEQDCINALNQILSTFKFIN